MMKKVLLTGGSGFIGRNLLESEAFQHFDVCAPPRRELDLSDDAAVAAFFRHREFDVVIHSAIKPAHRAALDLGSIMFDNSRMFFNLIKNKNSFERLIHMGSGAGYDMRAYRHKLKESDFGNSVPADELGLYKYMVGRFSDELPWLVDLRIFGIYGQYEDYSIRFISNMICKAFFDIPLTMNQDRMFDYLYVKDLPEILAFFINNTTKYNAYNVTPDAPVSLYSLARLVLRLCGKDLPIIVAKDGMGTEYSGDNSRLREVIPAVEFTDLGEGIRELVDYYTSNSGMLDKNKLLVDR